MTWRLLIERLFAYFRRRGVPEADADDLTNETLRRLTRTYLESHPHWFIEPLPGDTERMCRWIAPQVYADWVAECVRRREEPLGETDPAAPETASSECELPASLRGGWNRLTPQEQAVVWMREVERLEYEEIAQRTGESVDTLRQRHYRAMTKLRGWAVEQGLNFWDLR